MEKQKLTKVQIERAHKWYRDHYQHINRLLGEQPSS